MKSFLGISFLFFLGACTTFAKPSKTNSRSVLAVKVTREEAKENCEAVGTVKGTYLGFKPNQRKALEDMRQKAFDKGANFVRLDSQSEAGTTAQGMAFKCPGLK